MKTLVYATPVEQVDYFLSRIVDACNIISTKRGIFERMRQSLLRRFAEQTLATENCKEKTKTYLIMKRYMKVHRKVTAHVRELCFVIGTHCCERVILVSVQSAASASATEIKDSRMQLRRATSAVHKRAAKCTQADGEIFLNVL
ncbi:hypothetical protein ANN_11394 [Periplaneta americana]|uniref:Uncharacterized protein n=1 Tax=Periplaneta americana TaxID=6978 RepID=A0ABQ8T4V8_PERAM|nr:hypothetical protein ANN_11394 [Periplaneta americana]